MIYAAFPSQAFEAGGQGQSDSKFLASTVSTYIPEDSNCSVGACCRLSTIHCLLGLPLTNKTCIFVGSRCKALDKPIGNWQQQGCFGIVAVSYYRGCNAQPKPGCMAIAQGYEGGLLIAWACPGLV